MAIEEFATARIAQCINRKTMSTAYENLQRDFPHIIILTNENLVQAFHLYMERVYCESLDDAEGFLISLHASTTRTIGSHLVSIFGSSMKSNM